MSLDATTLDLLKNYASCTEDWYGPWNTILLQLFPSTIGYVVTPHKRFTDDDDLIIDVSKIPNLTKPLTMQKVLIVQIKTTQDWPSGVEDLKRQLTKHTNAAFPGSALEKVYWIGVIGPHWLYGEKLNDDKPVQELIEWHHTLFDLPAFNDLQNIATLVKAL